MRLQFIGGRPIAFLGLLFAIASAALTTKDCLAVTTVTVSPSTYTLGDVATPVTVEADTAAAGNELIFDVYIDVDGDGNLDPEDARWMSFPVADGQAPHLGNKGFWHDEDGATNSSVKAALIVNGFWWWFSGHFIVKVTDEDSSWAIASFTVVQDSSYPCVVTGQVQLGGSPAGGAIVAIMDLAADAMVSMHFADADGRFELRVKSPGSYAVFPFQPGSVTNFGEGSGQMIQVSEGSNPLSAPLVLFAGNRTISGKVFASDTGEGFRGMLVMGWLEDGENLQSVGVTDDDGSYTLNVMDGGWEVGPMPEHISRLGYVCPTAAFVTVSGSDEQGIDLSCPRVTTLITGTVKDAQTQEGLQGIVVWAELGDWEAEAVGCSGPDGSYAIGVIEGDWEVEVDEDRLYGTAYAPPPRQRVSAPASGKVPDMDFLLEKAGRITGHVYEDDGQTPVPGAKFWVFEFMGDWVAGTETLADGSYSVSVPSGTYTLHVFGVGGWSDQDSSPVGVTAPYETSGIDFILERAATIRGHVYQDDGVTPIHDAWVSALDPTTRRWVAGDLTEQDGSYSVSPPSGSYKVQASVDGWASQYYDGVYDFGQATTITLTAPEVRSGMDFVLQGAATISGHVYQDDGITPVPGARVSASEAQTGMHVGDDRTDQDGSYSISVASGSYKLKAEADGWVWQYYDGVSDFDQASTVSVTAPEGRSGIDFVLQRGATITGHVYQEDGSTPLAGAWVRAHDATRGEWVPPVDTDSAGFYSLTVPSGSYRVQAGKGAWLEEWYDDTYHFGDATTITVTAPEVRSGVDFALLSEALAATISGHVYETGGVTPISGARVEAIDAMSRKGLGWVGTDGNGFYTLAVPSGGYKVRAEADGWPFLYYPGTYDFDQASTITVTAPQERTGIDFALQPGARITGHVYQEDGATPLAGARVQARDATTGEWPPEVWTDAGGFYSLTVRSGSYQVQARKDGWVPQWYDGGTIIIVTVPEVRSGVDFVLRPEGAPATITGHVYESGGVTLIPGASVSAFDAGSGDWVAGDDTDASGFYSISVPSGSYKVQAEADGWPTQYYYGVYVFGQAATITLTASEERSGIDFLLLKTGEIKGHVYRQDGVTPVANAWVRAYDQATGQQVEGAQSGDDGSYIVRLPPGTYRVRAGGCWRCISQEYATPVTVGDSEVIDNIDFSIECRSFTMEALRWSTKWAGGLELQWQSMPDATYRIYWNPGSLGDQGTWQEVPNAQEEILQQDDTMIWTDRGTAPGMNGNPPGDPNARQRFYKVEEEPE